MDRPRVRRRMKVRAFNACVQHVLVHEGGFVNHPKDPGGATNRGVTQRVYDGYRSRMKLSARSVAEIDEDEVLDIYYRQYWCQVAANDLPTGIDYAVFDFAVNSGPVRSTKFLQRIIGATPDGAVGFLTLDAIERHQNEHGLLHLMNKL